MLKLLLNPTLFIFHQSLAWLSSQLKMVISIRPRSKRNGKVKCLLTEDCPQTDTQLLPSCKENKEEVVQLKHHPGPLQNADFEDLGAANLFRLVLKIQTLREAGQVTGMAGLPEGQNNLKLQHIVVKFRWMRCWKPERLYMGCDFCWQDTCAYSFNLSKILRTEMDLKARWVRIPSVGEVMLGVIKRNDWKVRLQKTHSSTSWPTPVTPKRVEEISTSEPTTVTLKGGWGNQLDVDQIILNFMLHCPN